MLSSRRRVGRWTCAALWATLHRTTTLSLTSSLVGAFQFESTGSRWLSSSKFSLSRLSSSGRTYATAIATTASSVSISDAFDAGNIEHVETIRETNSVKDHTKVLLRIKPDPWTELEQKQHFQYFCFRSMTTTTSNADTLSRVEYVLLNAGEASYTEGCYQVFWSTQLDQPDAWRRLSSTTYDPDQGTLSWTHPQKHEATSVYFAYFPPYSYARHLHLIQTCISVASSRDDVVVQSLGQSLDGRELECIQVGSGPLTCWIIARQHPGEHMAEYFAEGLLTRLLGLDHDGVVDGMVHRVLRQYTFFVVPNMNPDGAVRGHLRTNACGANLNREWASSPGYEAPTLERSPEVYHVLQRMQETKCDVFLDIHGDEALPYNFLAQAGGPQWGPRLEALHGAFAAAYTRSNPDMQQAIGYDPPPPFQEGDDVLNIANDQVANQFDCLSVTLEMPFKDCRSNPDPQRGWCPARAQHLGASVLDPLLYNAPYLRAPDEFWKELPAHDAYVLPTSTYKK